MKEFLKKRRLNILCSLAALIVMWAVWFLAYTQVGNGLIIPSFEDTVASFWQCLGESSFWTAFGNTFLRTVWSFLISFVLAAALAALASFSKTARAFIAPFMVILRVLPTLAVILLIVVWTDNEAAPVIVTVLVLFPMIYAQMLAAIDGVDGDLIQMARVYEVKTSNIVFRIYLPLISPNILSQTGANISLGLKIMVSAEVLCATYKSLGGLMQYSRNFLEMPRLAALTLAAVIMGIIVELAFSQLKRINKKWQGGEKCLK